MSDTFHIETEIGEIGAFEDGDEFGRKGFVDVISKIKANQSFSDVRGVITTRVFFTDAKLPFEQLTAEARLIAQDVLSRLLKLGEAPVISQELRQRWR